MVNPVTRPRGHFADSDTTDGDNSRRSRPQRLSRLSLSDESCYNPRFFQSAQAPNCVKGGRRNTGHRLSSSAGLSEAAYSTTAPSQCSGDFLDEAQYNPFYNRNRADIDTKKMTPCEWPLPSVGKKQLGLSRTNGNRALTHGIPTTTNRSSISFRRMWEHFRGLWRQSACFRVVVVSSFFALAVIIVITVLSATGTFSNNGQIPSNRQSANAANNLAMHDYGIRFQLEDPPAASFVQISDSTSFVQADDSETNIKPEYQTATWKMISTFKDPTTIIFDEPSDPRVSIHPQEITVQPADRKSLRVETVCSKETVGNCESGLVYAWRFLAGGQILIEGGSIGEKSFSPFEVQLNGAHHTFSVPKYKQLVDPVHLSESDFSKLESLLKTPETGVEFRFEGNGEILHLPVGWRFKDPTPTKVGEEPKMIEGNPICLNAYRGSVLVMAEDGGEGLPVLPSVIDGKIEVKVSSNANQQQRLFVSFFDGQVQPQPQWAASEGTTPPGETKPIDAIAQEFLVLPNQQEVLSIEVPRKCRRSRGTDCTFTISAHQPTELFSNGDERQIAVESSVKVMHSGGKFFVREIETPGFKDKPTMTKFEDWVTMPADEKQAAIDVDQRERQQRTVVSLSQSKPRRAAGGAGPVAAPAGRSRSEPSPSPASGANSATDATQNDAAAAETEAERLRLLREAAEEQKRNAAARAIQKAGRAGVLRKQAVQEADRLRGERRRQDAATKVQAAVRQKGAAQQVHRLRQDRLREDTVIAAGKMFDDAEAANRLHESRRSAAAGTIQRSTRRKQARTNAATKLQAVARRTQAVPKLHRLRDERRRQVAATKVQAAWRRKHAVDQVNGLRDQRRLRSTAVDFMSHVWNQVECRQAGTCQQQHECDSGPNCFVKFESPGLEKLKQWNGYDKPRSPVVQGRVPSPSRRPGTPPRISAERPTPDQTIKPPTTPTEVTRKHSEQVPEMRPHQPPGGNFQLPDNTGAGFGRPQKNRPKTPADFSPDCVSTNFESVPVPASDRLDLGAASPVFRKQPLVRSLSDTRGLPFLQRSESTPVNWRQAFDFGSGSIDSNGDDPPPLSPPRPTRPRSANGNTNFFWGSIKEAQENSPAQFVVYSQSGNQGGLFDSAQVWNRQQQKQREFFKRKLPGGTVPSPIYMRASSPMRAPSPMRSPSPLLPQRTL